jgi:RNA ligase (TIGR02306 family)
MAFFGITQEKIEKVWTHPKADRLDLAKLEGKSFQFVVGRGSCQPGEECLYFPVDSLIPDELMLALGVAVRNEAGAIEGKLAGPNKNRLKTVRLREEISQGLIGPLSLLDGLDGERTPERITEFLGVQKWEAPVIFDPNADLLPLPLGLSAYDIEGAERFESVVAEMLDLPVAITEKLEGMNFSAVARKGGVTYINQRRFTLRPREGTAHPFWETAGQLELLAKAEAIRESLGADHCVLYGEFVGPGIQGNIYGFKKHQIYIFDILVDGVFLAWKSFSEFVETHRLQAVPVLERSRPLREILAGRSVHDYSNGTSLLFKTAREGVVIRPVEERHSPALGGRLILKQRSPLYLSKSDN